MRDSKIPLVLNITVIKAVWQNIEKMFPKNLNFLLMLENKILVPMSFNACRIWYFSFILNYFVKT